MFGGILMIKVGKVSSVNVSDLTAKVFFELDGVMSIDLKIVQRPTLESYVPWTPRNGEEVLCVYQDNRNGFIVGVVM